jgi:transcription initiation factor IIE alpha subunit
LCIAWLVKNHLWRERKAVLDFLYRTYGEVSAEYVAECSHVAIPHVRFVLRKLVQAKLMSCRRKHRRMMQVTVYMVRNDRRKELKL